MQNPISGMARKSKLEEYTAGTVPQSRLSHEWSSAVDREENMAPSQERTAKLLPPESGRNARKTDLPTPVPLTAGKGRQERGQGTRNHISFFTRKAFLQMAAISTFSTTNGNASSLPAVKPPVVIPRLIILGPYSVLAPFLCCDEMP